jgi:hypothetical protein
MADPRDASTLNRREINAPVLMLSQHNPGYIIRLASDSAVPASGTKAYLILSGVYNS